MDGDGINEFLVSSNNNIGLYKYDNDWGWNLVWLTNEGGGGAVLTLPFLLDVDSDNLDEIVLTGTDIRTRIYDLVQTNIRGAAPEISGEMIGVHPNPANDKVVISLKHSNESKCTIYIYDILGRIVNESPLLGDKMTWDLTTNNGKEVSSGLYFIHFINADGDILAITRMAVLK